MIQILGPWVQNPFMTPKLVWESIRESKDSKINISKKSNDSSQKSWRWILSTNLHLTTSLQKSIKRSLFPTLQMTTYQLIISAKLLVQVAKLKRNWRKRANVRYRSVAKDRKKTQLETMKRSYLMDLQKRMVWTSHCMYFWLQTWMNNLKLVHR